MDSHRSPIGSFYGFIRTRNRDVSVRKFRDANYQDLGVPISNAHPDPLTVRGLDSVLGRMQMDKDGERSGVWVDRC
jgi:hypothetical protein